MLFDQQQIDTLAPLVGKAVVWVQQQIQESRERSQRDKLREIARREREAAALRAQWRDEFIATVPRGHLGRHPILAALAWKHVWSLTPHLESVVAVLERDGQSHAEMRLLARGTEDRVCLGGPERFPHPWLFLHDVCAVTVLHNHPGGTLDVSPEDARLAETIARACADRDVRFEGFLIVAEKLHLVRSTLRNDHQVYAWKEIP
jgi:hypothetical protein